jgi:hypothetical protein
MIIQNLKFWQNRKKGFVRSNPGKSISLKRGKEVKPSDYLEIKR